ncbi:MAG: tRNA lysidine(34) synthetase TilS [bacterium]
MITQKAKQQIKNLISKNTFSEKPKILLALSGGPDSVFLFHILKKINEEKSLGLICAHLNHEWRIESGNDQMFCKKLCEKHNIQFFTSTASELNLNLKYNGSKEEIGRKLRRHFFEKIKNEQNCDFIATAHHQQDNFETFFLRLIRGCSLSGLTGIKEINGKYLRPLLNLDKQEILNYLNQNKIEYLIDPTNESDDFLRNRIRKYILPTFSKIDERANKKLESSMQNLKEVDDFLQKIVIQKFNEIFILRSSSNLRPGFGWQAERANKQKNCFVGNLNLFKKQDSFLQKQLILHWLIQEKIQFNPSKSFINEIIRFLNSKQGGNHQTGSLWKIHKKERSFWINRF